jgi:short-subunit dehydrogenase
VSRVVVVTGATAGVGRALVRRLAGKGDSIALLARGQDRLRATADEVRAAGGRALALGVDVSDDSAVESAAARIEEELGPIDVWVTNAMAAVLAPVCDTTAADIARVHAVTFLGTVHGTQAALRRMRPRDRGVIVQVGSALAYRAIPLQATYCSAKHAIRAFSDSLRCELLAERSAVRVTMVQLPGLNTPQFGWVRTTLRCHPKPVAPFYEPELAAEAIDTAIQHPRRELWAGSNTVAVIRGNQLAPRLAEWYLARTNLRAQRDEDHPIRADRPDYLYAPLTGDRGARGIFSADAKQRSVQLRMLAAWRRATDRLAGYIS